MTDTLNSPVIPPKIAKIQPQSNNVEGVGFAQSSVASTAIAKTPAAATKSDSHDSSSAASPAVAAGLSASALNAAAVANANAAIPAATKSTTGLPAADTTSAGTAAASTLNAATALTSTAAADSGSKHLEPVILQSIVVQPAPISAPQAPLNPPPPQLTLCFLPEASSLADTIKIIEKSLITGKKIAWYIPDQQQLTVLDHALWTRGQISFLPHATDRDPQPERQPLLLTAAQESWAGSHQYLLFAGSDVADQDAEMSSVITTAGQVEVGADSTKAWTSSPQTAGYEKVIITFSMEADYRSDKLQSLVKRYRSDFSKIVVTHFDHGWKSAVVWTVGPA